MEPMRAVAVLALAEIEGLDLSRFGVHFDDTTMNPAAVHRVDIEVIIDTDSGHWMLRRWKLSKGDRFGRRQAMVFLLEMAISVMFGGAQRLTQWMQQHHLRGTAFFEDFT